MSNQASRKLGKQLFVFLLLFGGLYGMMQLLIGLSVPGGKLDWPRITQYFDLPAALRYSLLKGGAIVLDIMNIDTYILDSYHLRMVEGRGIRMVYSCMGYGIMSFWIAFAVAFSCSWKRAAGWALLGISTIWFINVIRICLLLIATNRNWPMPFRVDHHTWFNVAVYLVIGALIYLFDRSEKKHIEQQT